MAIRQRILKKKDNSTRKRENERARIWGMRCSLREKKKVKKEENKPVNINVFNDLVHTEEHVNTWIDYHNASINI